VQSDYIESLESPDLPPTEFEVLEGDVLLRLRNVNTRAGLAKGRRCVAREMGDRTLVVSFDEGADYTFRAIRMDKKLDWVEFVRWQAPFRFAYGRTVHQSQGMTLNRAVIDCRTQFWKHGQLYVALSYVASPRRLCVLLPPGMMNAEIVGPVDEGVMAIIEEMSRDEVGDEVGLESDVGPVDESELDPPMPSWLAEEEGSSDDKLGLGGEPDGSADDDVDGMNLEEV
jgi:hypothetical protein